MPETWLFAVVPVLIVAATVLGAVGAARRRRLPQAWAQERGWSITPSDPGLAHRWQREPFGRGGRVEATEVLRGTVRGRAVTSFTYRRTTGR